MRPLYGFVSPLLFVIWGFSSKSKSQIVFFSYLNGFENEHNGISGIVKGAIEGLSYMTNFFFTILQGG
jgi:hypothetical protein